MRPHLIYRGRKKFSRNTALIYDDQTVKYSDYFPICWAIRDHLANHHQVRKGQKVVLLLRDSPLYVFLIMSLQIMGAIAVHLNWRFPRALTKKLLANIFYEEEKKLVITDGAETDLPRSSSWQRLEAHTLLSEIEAVKKNIQANGQAPPTYLSNDQWVDITFTSASTGVPKAVLHSYGNHYYSALGANLHLPLGKADLWLLSLPLFHAGGQAILYRTALAGAGVVAARPDNWEEALFKYPVSHLSLVPTQLHRLLKDQAMCERLKSLKAILVGGGRVFGDLVKKAVEMGLRLHLSYGSSEMSSQICTSPPSPASSKSLPNTTHVGKPLPLRQVKVNAQKEILVKGPCLFKGYYTRGRPLLPLDTHGFFHTGDQGEFDANGSLAILGRMDLMFTSGGENIHPQEIERALEETVYVEEALVVGVPDPEFGARPAAFLRLKDTYSLNADLLQKIDREMRRVLPPFKLPTHYFKLVQKEGLKPSRKKLVEYAKRRQPKI